MVIITIIIPLLILKYDIPLNMSIIPLFIFMYVGSRLINNNAHRIYIDTKAKEEDDYDKNNKSYGKVLIYSIFLIITGGLLFLTSELLGNTLENLCGAFGISEVIVGMLLGVITSIPELITFFESQRYHKNKSEEMSGIVEATNNLFTSNIVNLFVIQTIGILLSKI